MKASYDDIIDLPHPTSAKHPRMPISDRAAQFAPFSALTGYDAALVETARLTQRRVELTEEELLELDRRQQILLEHMDERPEVAVTWFLPDERKEGGRYITTVGCLKRIDAVQRVMLLVNGEVIPLDDIVNLASTIFSQVMGL